MLARVPHQIETDRLVFGLGRGGVHRPHAEVVDPGHGVHLRGRVRGETDQGIAAHHPAHLRRRRVVLAHVHAVRCAGDRKLGPVVHDEQRVVGVAEPPEYATRAHDVPLVPGLLAQLHDIDARLQRGTQQLLRVATAGACVTHEVKARACQPLAPALRRDVGLDRHRRNDRAAV
jgi:hypothetical protein